MDHHQEQSRIQPAIPARQRSSAACDACRARKTKCVYPDGELQCSICKELNITCTKVQPRKKRGRKNKFVEAFRVQLDSQKEDPQTPSTVLSHSPLLQTPETKHLHLEFIGPLPVLHQIIDDWFGWLHPVAPIFHRAQFLTAITRCEHESPTASFLILVASLCAATVSSLRRRRQLYGPVSVHHCLDVAQDLGLFHYSHPITLDSSLACYNFSSAAHHEYGFDSTISYRLQSQAAIGVKFIINQGLEGMPRVEQETLKRLYWLLFAGQCTCEMHGRPLPFLHHEHEQVNALVPLEISDDELIHGITQAQSPVGNIQRSYVPGLNALSKLYSLWQSSQAILTQTMANLREHIKRVQHALDDLAPELTWKPHPSSPNSLEQNATQRCGDFGTDAQTANLKITQLHIRSNLLEQMNSLARAENLLLTPSIIVEERHRVVDELLQFLDSMPNEVFDANGYSIVPKIRDIGSALLDELRTGSNSTDVNLSASINLDRLLKKLEDLDTRALAPADFW